MLNNSSYFNPVVDEHLLLTTNHLFFPFYDHRVSKPDFIKWPLSTKFTLSNHFYLGQLLSNIVTSKMLFGIEPTKLFFFLIQKID